MPNASDLALEEFLTQQLTARVAGLTALAQLAPTGVQPAEPAAIGRWASSVEWMRTDEVAELVNVMHRRRGVGDPLSQAEALRMALILEAAEHRRDHLERPFQP